MREMRDRLDVIFAIAIVTNKHCKDKCWFPWALAVVKLPHNKSEAANLFMLTAVPSLLTAYSIALPAETRIRQNAALSAC